MPTLPSCPRQTLWTSTPDFKRSWPTHGTGHQPNFACLAWQCSEKEVIIQHERWQHTWAFLGPENFNVHSFSISFRNFEWMQTTLNVQSGNPNQWNHGLGKGSAYLSRQHGVEMPEVIPAEMLNAGPNLPSGWKVGTLSCLQLGMLPCHPTWMTAYTCFM